MATKRARKASAGISAKAMAGESLVVYIHGVGTHPPPAELKQRWDLALFGKDVGERSRMAYWADIVHPPSGGGEPTGDTIGTKSASQRFDLDRALEQVRVSPKNEDAVAFAYALARHLGVTDEAQAGVGKKVLPLPSFLRKPIARQFLNGFVGDTAAYFFMPDIRKRIRQRLIDALPDAARPLTIVAHSQGSIVAYEVLSALKANGLDLVEFVTIGSPLGIQEVQDFLEPGGLAIPSVMQKWHNFADPLDPVALDKGIGNDFSPHNLIQDEVIVNGQTRQLLSFNPHSAVGYLSHPSVRKVVSASVRIDTMARFVLARDVAERLGALPDDRHSVLIEVLEPGYNAVDESAEQCKAWEQVESVRSSKRKGQDDDRMPLLSERIARSAERLAKIVKDPEAARIDTLRRFVSARLTARELQAVADDHRDLRVYAVWRSSSKRKLTSRSTRVIKADAALTSFGASGSGITWAVLDTGVRADHPHFADGVVNAVWDCTRRGRPQLISNPIDRDGHGTHVCGIVAGRAPPDQPKLTQRGMAPKAKLVVYKVLDDKGSGEDAWIIKALDHIAELNENQSGLAIHGLNLSLGGPFDSTVYGCGFSPICAELRRLWRSGVLVVVASGNEGQLEVQTSDGDYELNAGMSIGDPANLEECIAVGSINADQPHLYGVSAFSSRGPTADGRLKPDVVAPGERISSCNSRFRKDGTNLYYEESGTSMAAPHVSGLLAAFLSVRREYRGRPDEVKQLLLATCTDIGRDRYHQGKGIPNLMQMLLAA